MRLPRFRAGSYLLMETGYEAAAPGFKTAITVLATVISKTGSQRVVIDAGMKALSCERGIPSVKDMPELRLRALHAEHGICDLVDPETPVESRRSRPDLGAVWRCYRKFTPPNVWRSRRSS